MKYDLKPNLSVHIDSWYKQAGIFNIYANYFGGNLDVTDVLKIGGVLETGVARLTAEAAWTTPDISIPSNVVYYE